MGSVLNRDGMPRLTGNVCYTDRTVRNAPWAGNRARVEYGGFNLCPLLLQRLASEW